MNNPVSKSFIESRDVADYPQSRAGLAVI